MSDVRSAWAGYWEGEPAAQSGATLANLPPYLRDLLDGPWRILASALPAEARVLDLATGGGVVLGLLQREREDLHLLGVDAAPHLPTRAGMTLRGGISNDALPFDEASFDAVTSRFGIEYGSLREGSAEAGRVLRPGGMLYMVVHHHHSRVVGHNRARSKALRWAAYESGWVERALELSRDRVNSTGHVPAAFRSAPAEGAARFPEQSVAWEFLTGLNQALDLRPAGGREAVILQLVARAAGELARLDALAAAACDDVRLAHLTGALAAAGVQLEPTSTIVEPDGTPLAWLIEGRKSP